MIFGIWGEDKTGKTSLALTAPKPLVFMEFDIGGFNRAIWRFDGDYKSNLIKYESYPMPMQFGTFDPSRLELRPSKVVVGMKELFYRWASAYIKHLQDSSIASIVIDTATLLYSITCDSYLQEKQETQLDPKGNLLPNEKLRVQLAQIEYREPNNRMRGIIYNAKVASKNLILVHHARDEYKPMLQRNGAIANAATGKRERAGFATLGDSADVIAYTWWQNTELDPKTKEIVKPAKPFCRVELAGVKPLEGMAFQEPTFDKIDKVIRMVKGME